MSSQVTPLPPVSVTTKIASASSHGAWDVFGLTVVALVILMQSPTFAAVVAVF